MGRFLSVQSFALSWFHHPRCFLQASSYPFYLIFVLLTSPVFGVATSAILTFFKVGCLVDEANIQLHCTIDNYVTIVDKVYCKAI